MKPLLLTGGRGFAAITVVAHFITALSANSTLYVRVNEWDGQQRCSVVVEREGWHSFLGRGAVAAVPWHLATSLSKSAY